jgi:hypothetical protein
MYIKRLVSETYLDIKKLSEENPNDMDLGKLIRAYVRQQEEMDSDEDTYNEELK